MFTFYDVMDELMNELTYDLITLSALKKTIIPYIPSLIALTTIGIITYASIKKFSKKKVKLPLTLIESEEDCPFKGKNVEIKAEDIFEEDKQEMIYRQEFIERWLSLFPTKGAQKAISDGLRDGTIVIASEVPENGTTQSSESHLDENNKPLWIRRLIRDRLYTRLFSDNNPTPFILVKVMKNNLKEE